MTAILFPYKWVSGRFEPIISVGIQIQSSWQPLRIYVDSGAMYSVLKSRLADDLGFDYRQGERISLQVGSGGLMVVYLHELEMQIGASVFPVALVSRISWVCRFISWDRLMCLSASRFVFKSINDC